VIATLEAIAEDVVSATGFFHNGDGQTRLATVQNGVARTNCIDCLDRTNAAQFVIGKRALGYQLHALGVISEKSVEYDTDAVNLFTHMSVLPPPRFDGLIFKLSVVGIMTTGTRLLFSMEAPT
jgi:hypothetical protein